MGQTAQRFGDTIASLHAGATARDPTRPLLTWYDDATGERLDLSGLTLDNWVAKTANLLVDGCGLGPGDRAEVALAPHWQSAAILLGCWSAGLVVTPSDGDVAFAAVGGSSRAPDRYALGFAPMGLPLRDVPAGWQDYVAEVRAFGDRFTPVRAVRPDDPATPTETHAALVARAGDRAAQLGLAAGGRVLLDAAKHPDPIDWLLAPLAAGATIVLCGNADQAALAQRAQVEHATLLDRP
jgi:uncharacterized protein (TIGR03089 family)